VKQLAAVVSGIALLATAMTVGRVTIVGAQESALCPPIEVMDGFFSRLSVGMNEMWGFVSSPGPTQRAYVEKARRLMAPLVCAGARRVAFVEEESGREAWVGKARPDLINVPESRGGEAIIGPDSPAGTRSIVRAELLHALVHEGTHAASNLLAEYDGTTAALPTYDRYGRRIIGRRDWTDAGLEEARRVVERARLANGLYQEWARVHDSFVAQGLAAKYHGLGPRGDLSSDHLIRAGFTTGYAGDRPGEDIAELTAAVTTRDVYAAEGSTKPPLDLACQAMRAESGPGVPERLASHFTKVGFLQSIGFLTDADYDYCVGQLKIRGEGSGVFSFNGDALTHEYRGNPRGTIGRSEDGSRYIFRFEADGSVTTRRATRDVTARLLLDLGPTDRPLEHVSFPRGLFKIRPGSPHSFQVVTEGRNGDQIVVDVTEGVVLVARASHALVEGSVVLQRVSDRTSLLPLPMPQRERVMTFRKVNASR
jgi:hypothetical protein